MLVEGAGGGLFFLPSSTLALAGRGAKAFEILLLLPVADGTLSETRGDRTVTAVAGLVKIRVEACKEKEADWAARE